MLVPMNTNSKEEVMDFSSVSNPNQCKCSYYNYFFKVDTFFPLPVHLTETSTVSQFSTSAPIVDVCY